MIVSEWKKLGHGVCWLDLVVAEWLLTMARWVGHGRRLEVVEDSARSCHTYELSICTSRYVRSFCVFWIDVPGCGKGLGLIVV